MYTYTKFKNFRSRLAKYQNKFSPILTHFFFYQLAGPRAIPQPMKKKPWCISKVHTSIPNDKKFDMSKLKAFADDKNEILLR